MADPALKRPDEPGLYERDFYEWSQEMARALREGRFGDLDIENVAEEIESLGRSDKREIRNRLGVLLVHLLKWRFQPEARSGGWRGTIVTQRRKIRELIDESPSLRRFPASLLAAEHADARRLAAIETGLPIGSFPELCPFRIEQVLDEDFLPESER
jgi:hypothetical protein